MARLSKSFKVGKSTRINLSRKGIGSSVGTKGFRVGAGPRGVRVTAKNPITGKSMQVRSKKGHGSSGRLVGPATVPGVGASAPGKTGRGCCLWPFVLLLCVVTGGLVLI